MPGSKWISSRERQAAQQNTVARRALYAAPVSSVPDTAVTQMPYTYEPLGNDQFRLLKLCAGPRNGRNPLLSSKPAPTDAVKGELLTFTFTEQPLGPMYTAVSYSWGFQHNNTKQIIFPDNSYLTISNHLDNGLRQLRQTHDDVYVWVDAICINQSNTGERSRQVRRMKDIYSRAQTVAVWLGMASKALSTRRTKIVNGGFEASSGPEGGVWLKSLGEADGGKYDILIPSMAIYAMEKPKHEAWWRRVWVLQEIAVSGNSPQALFDGFYFDLECFLQACESVLGGGSGITAPTDLRRRIRGDGRMMNLGRLLHFAAHSQASDPHDHVFALLGLAAPMYESGVRIDYERSSGEVFEGVSRLLWRDACRTFRRLYPTTEDRQILSIDDLCFTWERDRFPSWYLDLTRPSSLSYEGFRGHWSYGVSMRHIRRSGCDIDGPLWSEGYPVRHHVLLPAHIPELETASHRDVEAYGIDLGVISGKIYPHRIQRSQSAFDEIYKTPPQSKRPLWTTKSRKVRGQVLSSATFMLRDAHASFIKSTNSTSYEMLSFDTFATKDGHTAVCYSRNVDPFRPDEDHKPTAQAGDHVVLIVGATTPVILRPSEGQTIHGWELIEPCMLSNDVCGCSNGGFHDASKMQLFKLV